MKTPLIDKQGKKDLEDYHDLLALRQAKADPRNQQGRSFAVVAKELGLKKKAGRVGKVKRVRK